MKIDFLSRTCSSKIIKLGLISSIVFLTGCDLDYWWSRGKPPTSNKLISLSSAKMDKRFNKSDRNEVKEDFSKIKALLTATHDGLGQGVHGDKLKSNLSQLKSMLAGLEGKLSFGSRPPYGELVGQLRGFQQIANESGTVDVDVFSLYTARVFFFMADELSVPAPVGPLENYNG